MGQVLIRNLDDDVIARLKAKAEQDGKSLEQSLRELLAREAEQRADDLIAFADRIRAMSKPTTIDATDLIREDRDSDHGRS